jgi:hypothetical protein
MGFWSDASPIVKGAIIIGAIGILVSVWVLLELPPFDPMSGEDTTQQRGLPPAE